MSDVKVMVMVFVCIAFLTGCSPKTQKLTLAISPYQDIAMIVNHGHLGLDKKYGLDLELVTMAWEDILPAISSVGPTVDVGFGSLAEYLTKQERLNSDSKDPVEFFYPAYIYEGGGFVTFDTLMVPIEYESLVDTAIIKAFLSKKIGAQKNSIYEMMIFSLSRRAGTSPSDIKFFDTPLNDGLLATQSGSLDIASAGLTQIAEAKKHGGRVVLTMRDLGFADITGFICKRSVLESKKKEIEILIRMWFDCVSYVLSDVSTNSSTSLEYLRKQSSTNYSLDEYRQALGQEYFPKSIEESQKEIIAESGRYYYLRIVDDMAQYLISNKIVTIEPKAPRFIRVLP